MQVNINEFNFYLPDNYLNKKSSKSEISLGERLKGGTWEKEEIKLITNYIESDDSVLELGACIGYLGVHVNSLIKNKENHLLIEANPKLIDVIEKNKELNDSQFKIENCMIGNPDKMDGTFAISDFILGSSRYSKSKEIVKVPVKPLTDYIKDFNVLIMDIEGGEYSLIDEYIDIIPNFKTLIIEFHPFYGFSKKDLTEKVEAIKSKGFRLAKRIAHTFAFIRI